MELAAAAAFGITSMIITTLSELLTLTKLSTLTTTIGTATETIDPNHHRVICMFFVKTLN